MAKDKASAKKGKIFKGVFKKKNKDKVKADEETVYDAQFDATSKVSSIVDTVNTPLSDPVHVILLLMDPSTRRFEILQLEFDSGNAKVKDIFDQIPISATEASLKIQSYSRLCNLKGEELDVNLDLKNYIESAGIVIAVPTGATEPSSTLARMATPILTNPKVHSMLISSGLNIADLPDEKQKLPSPIKEVRSSIETPSSIPSEASSQPLKKKSSSGWLSVMAFLVIMVHLTLKVHIHYTATFKPGDTLSSGRSRGQCGLLRFSSKHECTPSSIVMSEDGVLRVTKGDKVALEAVGPEGSDLTISDDGKILIGGKKPKIVKSDGDLLKNWPFSSGVQIPKKSIFG